MSNVLISVGMHQLISFFDDDEDELLPQAEVSVKTRLVLEAVTKDAKILVTEEELNEKIEELAKTYGREADELKKIEGKLAEKINKEQIKADKKYIIFKKYRKIP